MTMAKFTDSEGRPWPLRITVETVKVVRAELGIDLADLSGKTLERLADDTCLLVDVLWVLCRATAKERSVSDRQFGEALVGDPIDQATEALLEAILDFFPSRKRALLRAVADKAETARARAQDLATQKLADPELDRAMTEAMTARMEAEMQAALTRLRQPATSPASPA
jgi:hypothetical protein